MTTDVQLPEVLDSWETTDGLQRWEYVSGHGFHLRGWRQAPRGLPVLHFVHGNGFNGLTYWPMLSVLRDHYDLFLHDVQGHGASEAGEKFIGWNRCASLFHKVWQHFQPEYGDQPIIGCGHSFGAVTTALWAAREPAVFRELLFLDPIVFSPGMYASGRLLEIFGVQMPNPLVKRTRKRRREWPSREEARTSLEGKGMFKGWHPDAHAAYINAALKLDAEGQAVLRCPPWLEAEIFGSLPKGLWWSFLRLAVPTHIIYGDQTYPFVKKSVAIASTLNSHITDEEVAGGHCFMQERPERVAQIILDHLQ